MNKISKEKMKEFEDRIKNFQYLRQSRVSLYQGIFIALLTSAIILSINLIPIKNILLKILLIILLIFFAWKSYSYMLNQTQKPIMVCENAIGTLEKQEIVKGKDGKAYAVCSISDFTHVDRRGKQK